MQAQFLIVDEPQTCRGLISLDAAIARATTFASPMKGTETVTLIQSRNRLLADDTTARIDLPPFDASAMDGYALKAKDADRTGAQLHIAARISAGERSVSPANGTAARIFTGAPVPDGADTVVMQEHVRRCADAIHLDGPIRRGSNIRRRGEDIRAGEPLLDSGTRLDARHIALLAAQGLASVSVRNRAKIAIVSTGNELCQPGHALRASSIYDSNRPMLLALASQAGAEAIDGGCLPDDPMQLAARLRQLAQTFDLVVTTGGASEGEEDHSSSAVILAGGRCEVLKIALKPGKPVVIGTIGDASYLGLPGNPVAALVSWLMIGGAILARLNGKSFQRSEGTALLSCSVFERQPGKQEFVPARLVLGSAGGLSVEILGRGGSARLKPLALADGLAEISANKGRIEPGDPIRFHAFGAAFSL